MIFNCSKGNEECDCPLREVRKMEIEDRIEYWDNLSREEKEKLIMYHKKCVDDRKIKIHKII